MDVADIRLHGEEFEARGGGGLFFHNAMLEIKKRTFGDPVRARNRRHLSNLHFELKRCIFVPKWLCWPTLSTYHVERIWVSKYYRDIAFGSILACVSSTFVLSEKNEKDIHFVVVPKA